MLLVIGAVAAAASAPVSTAADPIITTFAGNGSQGFSGDGGPATDAAFFYPHSVALAPDGALYIADSENNRIRKVSPDGTITTLAGNGTRGFSGDGGPANEAQLNSPQGVAASPDGSIYIVDLFNYRIRKVSPDGTITTIAGNGTRGFSGDGGPATDAQLNSSQGVAASPDGSIYIADFSNHRIRKVSPDGTITTFAGNGVRGFSGDGGAATDAQLNSPSDVATSSDGSIYISDFFNRRIRKVSPDGTITTFAGNGTQGFSGDDGPATEAQLDYPGGVATSPDGSVYIVDRYNERIRKVSPDGTITTFAGNGTRGFSGDGGPATDAQLDSPVKVAASPDGSIYFTDANNKRVRRVGLSAAAPVQDTTAPESPTITEKPSNPANSSDATFRFTGAEPAGSFECKLDGGEYADCVETGVDYTSLADGEHSFFVRQLDDAGNASAPATYTWSIVSAQQPDETPVEPAPAPAPAPAPDATPVKPDERVVPPVSPSPEATVPEPLPVRPARGRTETVTAMFGTRTLFAFDRAVLTPRGRQAVRSICRKTQNATSITISAHTSSEGSRAYNRSLSHRRAQAMQHAIAYSCWTPTGIVRVRAYGESRPRASNRTRRGRALNRRVEVTITSRPAPTRSTAAAHGG